MGTNARKVILGNCYATSEALYHLLGGKRSGWKPMVMTHEGVSHWFLRKGTEILDLTVMQFRTRPDYTKARGCGFLTKKPSRRAQQLMIVLVWK